MFNNAFDRRLPLLAGSGRVRRGLALGAALLVFLFAWQVQLFAIDQAKPGEAAADPHAGLANSGMARGADASQATLNQRTAADFFAKQDRTAFEKNIVLDKFRLLAIQHEDQLKIIDSWARQSISRIRNRQRIDGKDPVLVALDMAFRPAAWADRNIVYIQAIPVREVLTQFAAGDTPDARAKEAKRMMQEGLVSPNFLSQDAVRDALGKLQGDSSKTAAVNKVSFAMETFATLLDTSEAGRGSPMTFLPPPKSAYDTGWISPAKFVKGLEKENNFTSPYSADQTLRTSLAMQQLMEGWQTNDVALANTGISTMVSIVGTVAPQNYPTEAKRTTELWYNRSFNGTLVAAVYFVAMTLFLMVAVGVTKRVEKGALIAFGLAVALHMTAMGVRWWLAGRIPIKNQFESVMGAACTGCLIGFALECWKRNGIFGVAFSFVGFLAMTTCLASPYVFGTDLGAPISKVAGILDDAWLYIHVNIVIASYALISASFVIAAIYLGLRQWYWVNPLEPGFHEAGGTSLDSGDGPAGGRGSQDSGGARVAPAMTPAVEIETRRSAMLDTLDQANMVVLQMAFWFLGIGVICGAVWADHSWGRPWGWDPKETFALVTWLVYLIIVHVRFVTKAKADWSAWLAVAGFGIMLFNWIGVNFFLAGLHSYA